MKLIDEKKDLCQVTFEDGAVEQHKCPLKRRRRRPEDDMVNLGPPFGELSCMGPSKGIREIIEGAR